VEVRNAEISVERGTEGRGIAENQQDENIANVRTTKLGLLGYGTSRLGSRLCIFSDGSIKL